MTRVAIAAVGDPLSPTTWSGVTAGLASGVREHGVEVVGLDATPPAARALLVPSALARRSRLSAWYTPEQHALRSRVVARRLRTLGALDGVLLMGAEFDLPRGVRYVTLQDMTLRQAREVHPVFSRLSPGLTRIWDAQQRHIYKRAVACGAASHWTAQSLRNDYGIEPVVVSGFGYNHAPKVTTRDWSSPRFLFVGREWDRKRGADVVEAFARLDLPGARLDVVGEHPCLDGIRGVVGHGPLRLSHPSEAVRVTQLFTRATCFVMPSACEPFGIAYAEAAAAGIPSIATAVGGAATIVSADSGVLVKPGDRVQLQEAMHLLADPETARRMGAAAATRARRFSWQEVAHRLLDALFTSSPSPEQGTGSQLGAAVPAPHRRVRV